MTYLPVVPTFGLSKQCMDVMEPMAPIEVRHIRDQLSGQ